MFVESGLGVRVKFDLANTVYLTVTAEHLATTRGLCGVYNNNADGEGHATCESSHVMFIHSAIVSLINEAGFNLTNQNCGYYCISSVIVDIFSLLLKNHRETT